MMSPPWWVISQHVTTHKLPSTRYLLKTSQVKDVSDQTAHSPVQLQVALTKPRREKSKKLFLRTNQL